MSMKLIKLDNVKVPPVPNNNPEYETRETPPHLPRLNFMSVSLGSMGGGKTTSLMSMIKMYDKYKSFDRVVWFSPSLMYEGKGKAFIKSKTNYELVYHEHFSNELFIHETEKMKADIEEYRMYLQQKVVWDKFCRCHNTDVLTLDELMHLEMMGWVEPQTEFKWGFPSFALVLDDLATDKNIFSPTCKGPVSKFFIAHRHHSCCVFINTQIHANGVPRQIRGVISVWMLFKCKSKKLQEDIANELSFKVEPNKMIEIWDFATSQGNHDFLLVDYKQNDINKMFKKGFDQQIIVTDE